MSDASAIAFLGLDDAPDPIETATREIKAGLVRRGLGRLNRQLRADPTVVEAWKIKVRLYQQLGFHDSAARALRHAANVSRTPSLLVSAGYSLQELKRHEDAVAVYRELLELAPASDEAGIAYCNLANSLSHLGRDVEAEDAFKTAMALEPTRATHAFNYYAHLRRGNRWEEAIVILKAGLPNASDKLLRGSFLRALSFAHAERDEGVPALAAAEEALAVDGQSTAARYLRGRGLALVGRLDEALVEMRAVLSSDPENADAKNAIAMLERAGVRVAKRPGWRF